MKQVVVENMMLKFKYSFLLFLFVGIIIVGCSPKDTDKFEKEFSFDQNLINTKSPELVCQLSEDSILLKDIESFTIVNDSSFVVVDGLGAYLYHISGKLKKQFGKAGKAEGEMLSPSCVYATSNFVYIWCESLMKLLIFDHEANYKYELSGFNRAVKKFVVNSSDEILYLYTSGFLSETENNVIDIIDIYNIAEKTSKKYGERNPEDEVLSTWNNSSGLYGDSDRFIYLHPGNLIIYILDMKSDKTVRYKIDDKAFHTTKITSHITDVMDDRRKLTDYLHNNSLIKGLYKDSEQFIIFSEIGQFDFNEQSRVMNKKERKVKLYIFDSSFNPIRTILFDEYIDSPNISIYSNSLYFITLMDSDEQILVLNRYSLYEEK